MYPEQYDLKNEFDLISDTPAQSGDIRTINLCVKKKIEKCQNADCESHKIVGHGNCKKEIYDIFGNNGFGNNEFVKIILNGKRFKCRSCGATFQNLDYYQILGQKQHATEDLKTEIIYQFLKKYSSYEKL